MFTCKKSSIIYSEKNPLERDARVFPYLLYNMCLLKYESDVDHGPWVNLGHT